MSHNHIHPEQGDKRVFISIVANLILTVAQVIGGILAGSLALIADALHNFSDVASLIIALGARKISRRPADASMTFGYGRIEIVAALINYTTLIVIGLYLIYEGGMRFIDPPEVKGWWVVGLGGIALVVDTLTAVLTWSMQKGSVNIRALFVHNLSDALASVAVIVGGVLILLFDIRWVDPAITILIAVYILYLAFTEIGGTVRTLMLGSPQDIETDAVIDAVASVDGVSGVHHTHFWQMQEHRAALETHVVVSDDRWNETEEIRDAIKARLKGDFGILHTTLQFEQLDNQCETTARYGHG
ncbi:MAG: cation diffusion facilitator family transporter [Devosia sp.]